MCYKYGTGGHCSTGEHPGPIPLFGGFFLERQYCVSCGQL